MPTVKAAVTARVGSLKDSYFKQAKINISMAAKRFHSEGMTQDSLI